MIHATQLIVLNLTKTGEKSVVLHTLSPIFGRRSFIVSVGKGTGMALFLPMNILDAEVVENSKSDLWRIRNISAGHPLGNIRSNMFKNSMTMFMSEVLFRTLKDGANEDGLFDWCKRSILTLDAMESDFSNFHLRFLLELAVVLGFSPTAMDIAPFAGEHLKDISALLESSFGEAMLLPLNGRQRNSIADALIEYIGFHAESRLEIRSLKVLGELYR